MVTTYKLDKVFGPVGTIAGIIIFTVGIYVLFYSTAGAIPIILGAFVGFTSTTTSIDIVNKRIKQSTNLFGFISVGNWINVEPSMTVEIKKSTIAWRTYSKGNRTLDISDDEYYVILRDKKTTTIPIMKVKSLDIAKKEAQTLQRLFNLTIVNK